MSLEFKIAPSSLDGSAFIPCPPPTAALGLRWRCSVSGVTVSWAGRAAADCQEQGSWEVLSSDAYYACLYVYTCMVCMWEMPYLFLFRSVPGFS